IARDQMGSTVTSWPPRRMRKLAWPTQVSDAAEERTSAPSFSRTGGRKFGVCAGGGPPNRHLRMSRNPRAGWVARSSKRPMHVLYNARELRLLRDHRRPATGVGGGARG